jgi:hypothetical protein
VRLYHSPTVKNPFLGGVVAPGFARCVIHRRHARARILSSIHFLSFGKFEDRSASFRPFVAELMRRVAATRPDAVFVSGMPLALWLTWIVIFAGVLALVAFAAAMVIGLPGFTSPDPFDRVVAGFVLVACLIGIVPFYRMIARSRPRRFKPLATGGGP